LVTDYPTFLYHIGPFNTDWSHPIEINGHRYQTLCNGATVEGWTCETWANNWGGGLIRDRADYECHRAIEDPTECTPDEEFLMACGFNNEGLQAKLCNADRRWTNQGECEGVVSECHNGDTERGDTRCGATNRGWLHRECRNGAWSGFNVCIH